MTSGIAPTGDAAKRVAAVLTAGGVALIPTDTVYGLVADPDNAAAVDRIYEIKGRPESQPIAVLVGPEFPLDRVAYEVPAAVRRVAKPFWASGSLTIVLRRKPGHLDAISAGAPTVGLRSPDHSFTQEVIASFGRPIAATSANTSGRPSPAAFEEVDPAIVDAGRPSRRRRQVSDQRPLERGGFLGASAQGLEGRRDLAGRAVRRPGSDGPLGFDYFH